MFCTGCVSRKKTSKCKKNKKHFFLLSFLAFRRVSAIVQVCSILCKKKKKNVFLNFKYVYYYYSLVFCFDFVCLRAEFNVLGCLLSRGRSQQHALKLTGSYWMKSSQTSNRPVHTSEPVTHHFTAQFQITSCFTFVAMHKLRKEKKKSFTQQICQCESRRRLFPDSITGISFKDSTGTDAN